MKKFRFILGLFSLLAILGCSMEDGIDDDTSFLETVNSGNIGATFAITNDNTGLVTITPTGEGVTRFIVDFGDGSPVSAEIKPGEWVKHFYAEGNYDVVVTGKNLAGETAQGTQPLTVSFRTPENLEINIDKDPQDNYTVIVSATADYAATFDVYFGESADEEPTPLMPGESVSHTYQTVGTYDVRVVALSGGEASLEDTKQVTITDPLFLPVDFESAKLDYTWSGFGGASAQVIDNPDISGINTSAKVVELKENAGAEVWAGASLQLDEPLDFSQGTAIKMNVWSPEAGVPVMVKIEDTSSEPDGNGNPSVFVEVIENTTTSGEWEEMTFDLSSAGSFDTSINYDRVIVFYDFGNPGEGATFYFDDISLMKLVLLQLPITFDNADLDYSPGVWDGTSFEVVANPAQSGANTSASMVGAITNSGSDWEGIKFNLDEPVDFSGDNKTVTMKLWSDTPVSVLLKLEDAVNGEANTEVAADHGGSGWEELSFNFSTDAQYSGMVIFVDGGKSTAGTFYLDDIRMGVAEYISLFSNVADDVTVDTWRTDWSVADYEEVTFDGRASKYYTNLSFVGIETVANQLDITGMTHLHVEFYTENATAFKVKLVDFGANAKWEAADAGDFDNTEHEIVFENPAQKEWVSLDIPLSDFTNLTGREHIAQLIFSAAPAGEADVYVTNIYFHN